MIFSRSGGGRIVEEIFSFVFILFATLRSGFFVLAVERFLVEEAVVEDETREAVVEDDADEPRDLVDDFDDDTEEPASMEDSSEEELRSRRPKTLMVPPENE